MRVLAKYLARVEAKLAEVVRARETTHQLHDRNRALAKLRDPDINQKTHCSTCGLPMDKHVSHDPPDVEKPDGFSCPKDWAPFIQAQNRHYQEALQTLTDAELSTMPLPISERRLRGIVAEVQARLSKQTPNRYAMIASDDDDL